MCASYSITDKCGARGARISGNEVAIAGVDKISERAIAQAESEYGVETRSTGYRQSRSFGIFRGKVLYSANKRSVPHAATLSRPYS